MYVHSVLHIYTLLSICGLLTYLQIWLFIMGCWVCVLSKPDTDVVGSTCNKAVLNSLNKQLYWIFEGNSTQIITGLCGMEKTRHSPRRATVRINTKQNSYSGTEGCQFYQGRNVEEIPKAGKVKFNKFNQTMCWKVRYEAITISSNGLNRLKCSAVD